MCFDRPLPRPSREVTYNAQPRSPEHVPAERVVTISGPEPALLEHAHVEGTAELEAVGDVRSSASLEVGVGC